MGVGRLYVVVVFFWQPDPVGLVSDATGVGRCSPVPGAVGAARENDVSRPAFGATAVKGVAWTRVVLRSIKHAAKNLILNVFEQIPFLVLL